MTTIAITEITKTQMHHARIAKAVKLDAILRAEYPALQMSAELNEDESRVAALLVSAEMDEGTTEVLYHGEAVPDLADLLEAAEEAGIDPEAGADEDDDKPSGSIVPEVYRQRYREVSSTGQSNGDWLAEQLTADTHGIEGFSVDDFAAVLVANSVDQSGAWARLPESGQRGWVGRWRMNGRQQLEKLVALRGVYYGPNGTEHKPDPSWLADTRLDHAKWIAKQQKIEEAMRDGE